MGKSKLVFFFSVVFQSIISFPVSAHFDINLQNLKNFTIPRTPGLLEGNTPPIVVNRNAAIQLGKALFWDTNVGTNGIACASCHFHAGADRRTRNQLNPGTLHIDDTQSSSAFNINVNHEGSTNYTLKSTDFPLFKLSDVDNKNSPILFSTDDVIGSSGVFLQQFQTTQYAGSGDDVCIPKNDTIFHLNALNTRQTTKRNAPTVINAAYNRRNFWDGRANNYFNGTSIFGPRDPNAKIWVNVNGKITSVKVNIKNASLASQALGPPTDMIEMSCGGRAFYDVAKKLLHRAPLESQQIHGEDSVLATLRNTNGTGLNTSYELLIKKAFHPKYWSGDARLSRLATGGHLQIEANFAFFFGLAIQLYENTLISDDAPFDSPLGDDDYPQGLSAAQKRGLNVFNDAHCGFCHSGPTFTAALNYEAYSFNDDTQGNTFVDRVGFTQKNSGINVDLTLVDVGFFNTSVVPDSYDVGLGGKDPWGNPLSFSEQYVNMLRNSSKKLIDNFSVVACNFTNPFVQDYSSSEMIDDKMSVGKCGSGHELYAKVPAPSIIEQENKLLDQGRISTLTTGTFKIPTLRNVELTGPFMHNGSMKSLAEVAEFYSRGGNYHNRRHADTLVFEQYFSVQERADLVEFLKSLTDERVRWEKAPFDHPSINVPNGHELTSSSQSFAKDQFLIIPAVGKNGRTPQQGPLLPFDSYLSP